MRRIRTALCAVCWFLAAGAAFAQTAGLSLLGVGGGFVGPGDIASGATAYYGPTAYSGTFAASAGPYVDLRRVSDNAACTAKMGQNGAADLTLGTPCGGQTVTAWIGASSATVTKFYDETGNNNHCTQGTAAAQYPFDLSTGGVNAASSSVYSCPASFVQTAVSAYTILVTGLANTVNDGTHRMLLDDRGNGTGHSISMFMTNGTLGIADNSNSVLLGQQSTATYVDGVARNAIGVFNGGGAVTTGQFSVYIGGTVVSSSALSAGSDTTPLTGNGGTFIMGGAFTNWNSGWPGKAKSIGVWPLAFSASQALRIGGF